MLQQLIGVAPIELGLIWAVTMGAAILRSFTGFGFALAAVPVYALFLTPGQAVVLSASLALGIGIQTLPQYARHVAFRQQWTVFAAAVPGTLLGAVLLQQLAVDEFRLALGALTILASLVLARFQPGRRVARRGLKPVVGLASGLMNGAFAIPGPPVIVYSMATETDPTRSRALMIAFFSGSSVLALTSYGLLGMLSQQLLLLAVMTYPAMLLGDFLGYRLFERFSGMHYRRIAVATCLLIGLSICLKALLDSSA
jgi:uncharacterized membrane protein YfcA